MRILSYPSRNFSTRRGVSSVSNDCVNDEFSNHPNCLPFELRQKFLFSCYSLLSYDFAKNIFRDIVYYMINIACRSVNLIVFEGSAVRCLYALLATLHYVVYRTLKYWNKNVSLCTSLMTIPTRSQVVILSLTFYYNQIELSPVCKALPACSMPAFFWHLPA